MATLREVLGKKLAKKEMNHLVCSFDVLGSAAIIEIPPELEKKEKLIGETLLGLHKHIKTVLKKAGMHSGRYRRQKLKVIAGKRTKTAEYRENGVLLKLDVEKVYFSPRLSTERKRIFQQVTPGEDVLVMFSGCGPYVCVIAKNTKAGSVTGIELNPIAHKFADENIALNKIRNAVLINGDAGKETLALAKRGKRFDRIVMPLPKDAENFLEPALAVSKKGTVIHFYSFAERGKFSYKEKEIFESCKTFGRRCRITGTFKCGDYSPKVHRVCIDFKVL